MLEHVTPSIAGDLLSRYDLRAGVRHGQHFLVDPNTVRRIVRLAGVSADETILEIGPGIGSLTVALSQHAKRVIAVEIDTRVAEALREVLDGAPDVELVIGDAMQLDLASIVAGPVRLVANLPYNVATPLILRVLDEAPSVSGGLVMVQRELGERWTARVGDHAYGSVSVHINYRAEAKIVGDVPKTVFMPPPKVESVLVAFTRRDVAPVSVGNEQHFFTFVRSAFGHRRKTLRNSLLSTGRSKDRIEQSLVSAGVAERARPQDVSLETYAALFEELS